MLINIGFGNVVNMDKVISIVRADAAPVKRMVQVARDGGMARLTASLSMMLPSFT